VSVHVLAQVCLVSIRASPFSTAFYAGHRYVTYASALMPVELLANVSCAVYLRQHRIYLRGYRIDWRGEHHVVAAAASGSLP
jgi:hypothetical protein